MIRVALRHEEVKWRATVVLLGPGRYSIDATRGRK